jgi:putative transport protein
MFLFAVGFRTGPEFFRGLGSSALPQLGLTALLCATSLGMAFAFSRLLGFDAGTTAGLLAGALTNSGAFGTATAAVGARGLPADTAALLANHLATSYAVTYLVGTVLVVWALPRLGPFLMRVDLARSCREYEKELGISAEQPGLESAYREFVVRAYRVPEPMAGKSVAELERLWTAPLRVVAARIRRNGALLDADPDEIQDRELLDIPTLTADLVLTDKSISGKTLGAVAEQVAARCIFALKLRRAGRELPFAPQTPLLNGDVLTVTGLGPEIERVAAEVGFVEKPATTTDLTMVAGALFLGGLIGLPTIRLGPLDVGLSLAVGALMGGMVLGYLRSVNPRYGRFPEASLWLFETLGLTGFLALVGLGTGPAIVAGLRDSGPRLLLAAVVLALFPHLIVILVGRYVVKMHPGIILGLCSGAGTSAPALAALQEKAQSKVPSLGYGMACAFGNVIFALWGTLVVMLLTPR